MNQQDHILAIANAGLDGMRSVMTPETSTVDVLSAVLSILARFVHILIESGVPEEAIRKAVIGVLPKSYPMTSTGVH